jgi:hypothetical protein
LILSHTHACVIGREEQVQIKETNTDPEQGKPRCI